MVWYYALPTGHLCIYLLACDVNLIDAIEGLKDLPEWSALPGADLLGFPWSVPDLLLQILCKS